nr:hypothetical protein [Tanacetum cinerariifolium]
MAPDTMPPIQPSTTNPNNVTPTQPQHPMQQPNIPTQTVNTHPMVTRAKASISKPLERMNCHVTTISLLPRSHVHALHDPQCKQAMLNEYNALINNSTWVLVLCPANVNIVRSMWLFQHKFHADDTLSRYKHHVSSTAQLTTYTNADWAGCPVTCRSTSGYYVFLGDNLLSWSAKRQVTLSRSSVEAEYHGVANVVAKTAWLQNFLLELHAPLSTATIVYYDNVSAMYLSTNPVWHQRIKHIEIDIHFVRDYVAFGQLRLSFARKTLVKPNGIRASRYKVMANEGDKNVGDASSILVDENYGQEEAHQGDKRSRGWNEGMNGEVWELSQVFFLASKDETPFVLKTFIIGLENLLSLKVKIIRCDNGTEFKNTDLNQFYGLKGIKREFSVPRTPQQNGIAERKNRTLIKATRTLLAVSLLLISFWAEAVNTACYVQNRVLVTKPHNKTPYELLHGRLPSIRFMGPFGCPVTILNTLEPLGKFQGKVDEGFLVGYSVCSKAFRTMNYHPILVENQTNSNVGFQDIEKVREEGTQTYVLFPVLSDGFTNAQNYNKDAHTDGKEHDDDDIQKSMSPDIHSTSIGAQTRIQGDKTENKDKGKSHVVTITRFRDLNAEFEECINNNSNGVNAGSSVSAAGLNFTNSTNDFSAVGPLNAAMPNLEDLSHNADDVGTEADINNMESIILVSPIPTTRIYKDHPTSQIIGDLSSTTQTKSMARAVRDQGRISQMFNEDSHTCLFACFLSQEEPKRVHQALKDPKEGIDYEEVFAPVVRIEAIRLFLAYASFMGFPVYQMDVKIAFLYGTIEEEVYVCQPPGFEDPEYPDKVYKVVKALYGLHQAPRAWNTIELPEGNNVVPLCTDTIRLVQKECSFHGLRSEDPNQHLNGPHDTQYCMENPEQAFVDYVSSRTDKAGGKCDPHDTQYCIENCEQAFVDYASSRTNEAGGLVSKFMASQDARLSKFEANFKQ